MSTSKKVYFKYFMEHILPHETSSHVQEYVHEHVHQEDFLRLLNPDVVGDQCERLLETHDILRVAFERVREASIRYVDQLVDLQDIVERKKEYADDVFNEKFNELVKKQSEAHDAVAVLAQDFEQQAHTYAPTFSWSTEEHPSRLFYAHLALFLAYETFRDVVAA